GRPTHLRPATATEKPAFDRGQPGRCSATKGCHGALGGNWKAEDPVGRFDPRRGRGLRDSGAQGGDRARQGEMTDRPWWPVLFPSREEDRLMVRVFLLAAMAVGLLLVPGGVGAMPRPTQPGPKPGDVR